MESNSEKLEDVRIVEKVLQSLATKFYTKKMILEVTKNLDTLYLDELEGVLFSFLISFLAWKIEMQETGRKKGNLNPRFLCFGMSTLTTRQNLPQ